MSPPSVLVVDDEPGMRQTVREILLAAGHDVAVAEDGIVAMRQLQERPFDVVVMDMRMPRRGGLEVLRTTEHPPPEFIVMTAYAVEEDMRGVMEEHPFAVLHKPFSPRRLLELVDEAIHRDEAGRTT